MKHEELVGPMAIVVATYDSKLGAKRALQAVKSHHDELHISDAAVLRKNAKGRVRVSETADWSGRKGMVVGGIVGGAIGVLTGGIGWLALGGAAAAGLTSRLRDTGFDNAQLRELSTRLDEDTSMFVVVCEEEYVEECSEAVRIDGCTALLVHVIDEEATAALTVLEVFEVQDAADRAQV